MNPYLLKISKFLDEQDRSDLKNTAGIMGAGFVTGHVGNQLNERLGFMKSEAGHAGEGFFKSLGNKKNLAAAGVLGIAGGVGDYAALKMHRRIEKSEGQTKAAYLNKIADLLPPMPGITSGVKTGPVTTSPTTSTATAGIRG